MPRRNDIKKILIIGSGPIIIGQAAEFDYAGTQACRVLKAEGYETVLMNSNPATIMTDKEMADHVYIEPLVPEMVKKVILLEKPDAIVASLGGQTALNLALELEEEGFLDEQGVQLLGTSAQGIRIGEDRDLFRRALIEMDLRFIPSAIASSIEDALTEADEIGYPVIVRPAFTLGGTGGGIARDVEELKEIADTGLAASRVHQVLIEKSIAGWKEIEYEVVRDKKAQKIVVCTMENFDPVGVHTGDSIVVAPAMTLSREELDMLRDVSFKIIDHLGIEGGCNVQFAVHPETSEYAIIEVNPRLSRSSALASKATGYPIAKISGKIAVGYTLDEIPYDAHSDRTAYNPPEVDYVVTKIPKWPFDKFVYAERTLGTQMKATGEVMSLADTFEAGLMKAVNSLEMNADHLQLNLYDDVTDEQLWQAVIEADDRRLFAVAEAIRRGFTVEAIHKATGIVEFFLDGIADLVEFEETIAGETAFDRDFFERAEELGYTETAIAKLSGKPRDEIVQARRDAGIEARYRRVSTCVGERKEVAPYLYSSTAEADEAPARDVKKAVVIGSGPIRIGQGIEFDYCSVHCVRALQQLGYEAIIANNNPETVSTDFDTSDRLYFEPLTKDYVERILDKEKPDGVICQFGGQTAIKLIGDIAAMGYPIMGTSAEGVDAAEDRKLFDQILEECNIKRPRGTTVMTTEEAFAAVETIGGYPVLVRPSYVLGGQGMAIVNRDEDMIEFMKVIQMMAPEHPILIDKYLLGQELEVDAVCDGEDVLIPGVMRHLERAGIHSGDSISIFPAQISERILDEMEDATRKLAKALHVIGLINIQFIVFNDELYVIEVNPRSSRTIPYISKVTDIPLVDLATRVMNGEKVKDLGYGTGIFARKPGVFAIKAPVFSFEKLHDVDTQLGPEMKSTGEVLGLAETYGEALYKAIKASGFRFPKPGEGILLTVRDADKRELVPLADKLFELGFKLYGTSGTANYLNRHGIPCNFARKIEDGDDNVLDLVMRGEIRMLVNTEAMTGRITRHSGFALRRKAIEHGIPSLSSLDTLAGVVQCFEQDITISDLTPVEIKDFAKLVRA